MMKARSNAAGNVTHTGGANGLAHIFRRNMQSSSKAMEMAV
ncbi:MAG: hypothetical protein ACLQLH_03455 [Terracidiphilus sp.]